MPPRDPRVPVKVAGRTGSRPTSRPGEVRLPAAVAVVVAIALYAALPNSLLLGPRFVIPGIEVVLLVPLIAINPTRLTRETRWSRIVSLVLVFSLIVANLTSLGMLLHALTASHITSGRQLLLAALQVWLTNIIAFGLVYWELDRGGAVARNDKSRPRLQLADFRFTQDEDDDTITEVAAGSSAVSDWVPKFLDYLYVSVTNSTAFSPTDTMPLSHRAKALMSVESVAALLTSLLVIARAVSILH